MAKNKPRRAVIVLLFRLVSSVILLLPVRTGLMLGRIFGGLSFYILGKERRIALKNLNIVFGDSKSAIEKRSIARKVFENLGKNLAEVISIQKFSNKDNINRYISCKNINILRQFVEENKGAMLLSAHFGNWEFSAHYLALNGFPVGVIARRVRMSEFEDFLSKARKKNNLNVLYRDAPAKEIVGLLKNKKFIGVMPDQDMDSVAGVFVDFFGKKAWTPSGPAVLSFLTGVSMVPCFLVRKAYGHEFLIGERVELKNTGNRERDILENTQRYTKVIEGYIRRYPEHWVWFHDRWKTMP